MKPKRRSRLAIQLWRWGAGIVLGSQLDDDDEHEVDRELPALRQPALVTATAVGGFTGGDHLIRVGSIFR